MDGFAIHKLGLSKLRQGRLSDGFARAGARGAAPAPPHHESRMRNDREMAKFTIIHSGTRAEMVESASPAACARSARRPEWILPLRSNHTAAQRRQVKVFKCYQRTARYGTALIIFVNGHISRFIARKIGFSRSFNRF